MTRDEVKEVFKVISYAYSRFDVNSEKVDVWYGFLKDQNPAEVMRKVEIHIAKEKFPPTIAEIITIKPKKSITQIKHEQMLRQQEQALLKDKS